MRETQRELPGLVHDPANYRAMSEPHESMEALNKAIEKFWDGVYALRNECRLPDVYIVIAANVMSGDGEGRVMGVLHAGDEAQREPMTAYAFGGETVERQERIAKYVGKFLKKQKNTGEKS